MATMHLSSMSLEELKTLQKEVTAAIADYHDRQKAEARHELEELAREKGFTFAELASMTSKKPRKPVAAKYANPANTSMTWSGRGRRPAWFIEALEGGKSLKDMEI